ncbi:MAG: pilus assembly FimT family protein [Minisyncoccota bacterium]
MKPKGFTFIELIVTVAIFSVAVSAILNSFGQLNQNQVINKNTELVATILREARSLTLASRGGNQYGAHLESSQVVLFRGSVYSSSDPDNIYYPLNTLGNISVITLAGGGSDVVFDRLTGDTSQSGTINLSLIADPSSTRTITISGTGLIETGL